MVHAMWDPDYCTSDAKDVAKRFLDDVQPLLDNIKAKLK
jgi:hypothetical protein